MVKQCGGTVEQCWWNSGTVLVEQCRSNSEGGTLLLEQCGGTVLVEQWNSDG